MVEGARQLADFIRGADVDAHGKITDSKTLGGIGHLLERPCHLIGHDRHKQDDDHQCDARGNQKDLDEGRRQGGGKGCLGKDIAVAFDLGLAAGGADDRNAGGVVVFIIEAV